MFWRQSFFVGAAFLAGLGTGFDGGPRGVQILLLLGFWCEVWGWVLLADDAGWPVLRALQVATARSRFIVEVWRRWTVRTVRRWLGRPGGTAVVATTATATASGQGSVQAKPLRSRSAPVGERLDGLQEDVERLYDDVHAIFDTLRSLPVTLEASVLEKARAHSLELIERGRVFKRRSFLLVGTGILFSFLSSLIQLWW